jgi:hypothetical protein
MLELYLQIQESTNLQPTIKLLRTTWIINMKTFFDAFDIDTLRQLQVYIFESDFS